MFVLSPLTCLTSEPYLLLQTVGVGKFQYLLLAYVGLAWISDAMEMMILSFVGPGVKCDFHITPAEESHISSVVFAGMMIGAYTWGARKHTPHALFPW